MAWLKNKKQLDNILMGGAILLLMVLLPVGIWAANSVNGLLTSGYTYAQQENTTAFYVGPILDGLDAEYRFASVNGTTIVEETPVWDELSEWDSVTITHTGTDCSMYFNWNVTLADLLASRDYTFRMKFNSSKALDVTINAVKFDGVTLTSVELFTGSVENESSELSWTWKPMDLLEPKTTLNKEITDESYLQIILEGGDTAKLTTGDTVQFQFALGEPDNLYTFTSGGILTTTAVFGGLSFFVLGMASTSAWNPLTNGPLHGYGQKGLAKARKSYGKNKNTRKRRK